jgi:hypothetical protein
MTEKMPLSQEWLDFCKRGRLPQGRQRKSVECSVVAGKVRGYYGDLVLDPTLDWTDSPYPSHDHTTHPRDHSNMVVEARVVNDMKGHLNDDEFWRNDRASLCGWGKQKEDPIRLGSPSLSPLASRTELLQIRAPRERWDPE